MRNYIKILAITALTGFAACEDPEMPKPVPATEVSNFSAKFLFINATPDAPALDLYVNNVKAGASATAGEAQDAYTTVPLTSNAVIANSNIRSKAAAGTIGGVLGSNDLIYRAGNNNANNFTASNAAWYSIFAVDSINRPKPLRTLNAKNAGDTTFYSYRGTFTAPRIVGGGDTTIYLNVKNFGVDTEPSSTYAGSNSIVALNLVKKYNGNIRPSFMKPIGIVPLGSSDVGGVRYYLLQDVFPQFANATDSTTKAGLRIVNAAPNSPALFVRLKFVSGTGADINIPVVGSNPVSFSFVNVMNNVTGGLQPSVGSRTATGTSATFQSQTVAPSGTPNTYNVEVSSNAGFTQIVTSATLTNATFGGSGNRASNYTILISGVFGGTGSKALKLSVIEHN
jgi:hypothetical protein